jgi:hypothetical protein
MSDRSSANCKCQQRQAEAMKNSQQLGLDELMIVNPGPIAGEAVFLGEDGSLYEVQGLGVDTEPQGAGGLFLGDDGTLYQVQGLGLDESPQTIAAEGPGEAASHELGRYFLGEDGMLYEVEDR